MPTQSFKAKIWPRTKAPYVMQGPLKGMGACTLFPLWRLRPKFRQCEGLHLDCYSLRLQPEEWPRLCLGSQSLHSHNSRNLHLPNILRANQSLQLSWKLPQTENAVSSDTLCLFSQIYERWNVAVVVFSTGHICNFKPAAGGNSELGGRDTSWFMRGEDMFREILDLVLSLKLVLKSATLSITKMSRQSL